MKILEVGGWRTPVINPDWEIIQADSVHRPEVDLCFKWGVDPIPCDDDSYDGFIAIHVLEHVEWWNCEDAMREVFRILKPGGFCEIHVPNAYLAIQKYLESSLFIDRAKCRNQWEQMNAVIVWGQRKSIGKRKRSEDAEQGHLAHWHKSIWTEQALRELFERVGFVDIEKADGRPPHTGRGAWHNLGLRGRK